MDDHENNDDPAADLETVINRMDPPFDARELADLFADQYSAMSDAAAAALQPQLNSISLVAAESLHSAMAPLRDLVAPHVAFELKGIAAGFDFGPSIAAQLAEGAKFDGMFESITGAWKSQFDGIGMSAVQSLQDALAPLQRLSGWADSMDSPGLAGFELMETSAAAEFAKTLGLSSGALVGDLAKIGDWPPAYEPAIGLLPSEIEMPDFSLMGNPLLETTIELAESNAAMGRRIDEQTELIRELRDEMAGLRQRQVEVDLRRIESELRQDASAKRDRRLSRTEVAFAILSFITAVVAIILGMR